MKNLLYTPIGKFMNLLKTNKTKRQNFASKNKRNEDSKPKMIFNF